MDAINRLLVTYLINATWQIVLIAPITALCSRLLRRVASEYRHLLWVAALILSVLLPLWSLHSTRLQNVPSTGLLTSIAFENTTSPPAHISGTPGNSAYADLWSRLPRHGPAISLSPVLTWSLVVCYAIFFLYRLARLCLAWRHTAILRKAGSDRPVSDVLRAMAEQYAAMFQLKRIPILCSTDAVGPLTLGIRRPRLLIPRKFSETAPESDLASALCHELAHIRRHDFLLNLIYELLYLPISFHPGAALMKARIDQTRELACDEMAAEKLSARATYARSLVSIAQSLCAGARSAGSGYALGLFDANTLEDRIMNLLDKNHRITSNLGRAFTALTSVALVVICFAVSVFSLQIIQAGGTSNEENQFLGTWQAQFKGEPFFTISLGEKDGKLTGGCFNTSAVKLDENGELAWVDENKVQTAVLNIQVSGSTAVLTLDDANKYGPADEFELQLVGADQAEGKFIISPTETGVPRQKPWIFKRLPSTAADGRGRVGMIAFTGPTMSIEKSELDAFKKKLQDELNTTREANGTIRTVRDVTSEIQAFWQMHGFYRARVKNIESSPVSTNGSEDVYAFIIDLEEGPQYRVSAVQWEGANAFSPAELQAMMPIQPSDILNPSKAAEGEQAIRAAYAARGYSQIAFTTQRLADDDNHTIIWLFKINESGVLPVP